MNDFSTALATPTGPIRTKNEIKFPVSGRPLRGPSNLCASTLISIFILAAGFFVPASNEAYAQLISNPTRITFGIVGVGNQSTKKIILKNTGTTNVIVSQSFVTGNAFSINGLSLPLTLKPGGRAAFYAIFAPQAAGRVVGSLSLTSSANNSPTTVSLAGTGATFLVSVSPVSTSFGNVVAGNSSTLPVILTNTGSGSITITQSIMTGAGFSMSGLSLPLTLLTGKNTSFDVTFDPTSTGSFTGSISVISNASNSPANASLSGIGVDSHSVALSWSPSTSQGIVGYDVYRSMVPGGPYNQMNSSLDPTTTYTDSAVQAGTTYYYVTTAVDSGGVQSAYSDQAEAVVPLP